MILELTHANGTKDRILLNSKEECYAMATKIVEDRTGTPTGMCNAFNEPIMDEKQLMEIVRERIPYDTRLEVIEGFGSF